jgi:hypothetical protein
MTPRAAISPEAKALLTLNIVLVVRLINRGLLSIEDGVEVFESALSALESWPHGDEIAQLRLALEHAASSIVAAKVDPKPTQ